MTRDSLAAAALAAWTLARLESGTRSLSRQELPPMDVAQFLAALAGRAAGCALALVGFGLTTTALRRLSAQAAPGVFTDVATDLHRAAAWRNDRRRHPVIVAYARGRVPGVNTLRHFPGPSSSALISQLLDFARQQPVFSATTAHRQLLDALRTLADEDGGGSYEQLRTYLAAWAGAQPTHGVDAPRQVLPELGLFADPDLFAGTEPIEKRLRTNAATIETVRDRGPGQMDAVRKRLEQRHDARLLGVFDQLAAIRRAPTSERLAALPLADVLAVLRPKGEPAPDVQPPPDPVDDEPDDTAPLNPRTLSATCTDALLEGREEDLRKTAKSLSENLRRALDSDDDSDEENSFSGEVPADDGTRRFALPLDRHFCSAATWGGTIETKRTELRHALEDYDSPQTVLFHPDHLATHGAETVSLPDLLRQWDEELVRLGVPSPGLRERWDRFAGLRERLLAVREELTHFPLEWFSGDDATTALATEYLEVAGELFGAVSEHYSRMAAEVDRQWARLTLDAVLALDVVQVRVLREGGRPAFKAVILPTHPLHLWRYWRLSRILRGLANELSEEDRQAVRREVAQPMHFLSVLFASRLPRGGAGQVLPLSNDLHRLATFENLTNAFNGPDGQDTLAKAVERFAAMHRNHVDPLRLVLVNPPQPGSLLLELVKLLDGRRRDFLPRLRVEIRGTEGHADRLHRALLFDTRERELLEDKVSNGRLLLEVNRTPQTFDRILADLRSNPAHLLAVFDEAPVSIRRGGIGPRLPMSPFCVRRNPRFQRLSGEVTLEVTAGDPPFHQFLELVKHAEGEEGEGTPYALTDGEALRGHVDAALKTDDFAAHWFFLADRGLPPEAGMQSRRLLRRQEDHRQVLLAARDYEWLAMLMQPVFTNDAPNLSLPPSELEKLLAEGAHLVGAGLLDLVRAQQGQLDSKRVIGLFGTLLAARDHLARHPEALIVSTDSQLARLWLRLGKQGERCDLFSLREESGQLICECIEVKTSKGEPKRPTHADIRQACVQLAATLDAVTDGFSPAAIAADTRRQLAAPRSEMLKEVLVQGCMARGATKVERARWAEWLRRLFGATPAQPALRGIVIGVWLSSAADLAEEPLGDTPTPLILRHLNDRRIEELLGTPAPPTPPPDAGDNPPRSPPPPPSAPRPSGAQRPPAPDPPASAPSAQAAVIEPKRTSQALLLGHAKTGEPVTWSPMIESNPHLLIAGLPGMGKTTCLLNLCRQLAANGVMPIVFSYHDDIDEKLGEAFPNLAAYDCRNLGFNPMRVAASDPLAHVETAGLLRDIFAAIFPDLGDLQLEQLRSAIKTSYDEAGWGQSVPAAPPPFRRFVEILRDQPRNDQRSQTLLARLSELDDFQFFASEQGEAGLLDIARPQVLRIHASRSEAVQRAYSSFALYRIYQEMFQRGRQDRLTHAIIFDEAHRASRLKLIPTMAKECRKFGLAMVLASQEARDFHESLFSAVANYLILRVTDQDARALARNVPSDSERRLADRLKALPKYQAFFISEGQRAPVQVKLAES